jgi:hypothetical protein
MLRSDRGDKMKYSELELTDENFDEEYEKLTDLIGNLNSDEYDVYDALPEGFCKQESEFENRKKRGFDEWVRQGGTMPDTKGNIQGNVPQVFVSGEIAFEFKNKFLSLHFNDAL